MESLYFDQLLQAVNIQVTNPGTAGGLDVGAELGGVPEDQLVVGGIQLH